MICSEIVICAFCNFICRICIGLVKNPVRTMFNLLVPIWEMIVCICKAKLDSLVQVNTAADIRKL